MGIRDCGSYVLFYAHDTSAGVTFLTANADDVIVIDEVCIGNGSGSLAPVLITGDAGGTVNIFSMVSPASDNTPIGRGPFECDKGASPKITGPTSTYGYVRYRRT